MEMMKFWKADVPHVFELDWERVDSGTDSTESVLDIVLFIELGGIWIVAQTVSFD